MDEQIHLGNAVTTPGCNRPDFHCLMITRQRRLCREHKLDQQRPASRQLGDPFACAWPGSFWALNFLECHNQNYGVSHFAA